MTIDTERALHEHTAYEAAHDPLTDTLNIAGLNAKLSEIDAAELEVAVLVVDGDNIKRINVELGYEAGDEAIVGTADTLRVCIRPEDIVARVGGDEFIVLLMGPTRRGENPTSLKDTISATLKRIPLCLEEFQANNPALTESGFGLSVGAAIRKPGEDFKDTKSNAEAKMVADKNRLNGPSTPEKEELMRSLAEIAIAAGITPREFANQLRTYGQ